jgi:hypothetical protein
MTAAAQDYQLGIILVLTASAISGLSGALSQKVLNNPQNPRHSLLLSAEMAVFGIAFLSLRLAMSPEEVCNACLEVNSEVKALNGVMK